MSSLHERCQHDQTSLHPQRSLIQAGCGFRLLGMLFMVIERFRDGNAESVGKRFRSHGRMTPDGVRYHASWVDSAGARCFEIMETEYPDLLKSCVIRWADLVDFEVVPVVNLQRTLGENSPATGLQA